MTTPSSRIILGKPKIEVTKVLPNQVGKNEEYFHGENWQNTTNNGNKSNRNSSLVTKNLMHRGGRNGEHSYVPFNLNTTSCGFMLREGNTQSTLWLTGKVREPIQLDTTSLKWIGELFMTHVSSFSW